MIRQICKDCKKRLQTCAADNVKKRKKRTLSYVDHSANLSVR